MNAKWIYERSEFMSKDVLVSKWGLIIDFFAPISYPQGFNHSSSSNHGYGGWVHLTFIFSIDPLLLMAFH